MSGGIALVLAKVPEWYGYYPTRQEFRWDGPISVPEWSFGFHSAIAPARANVL